MLWYFWSGQQYYACFLLGKFPFETVKVMLRLLRFSKCDWLRNPSLFFQQVITWVFSFFARLAAATCFFGANSDWFIVTG